KIDERDLSPLRNAEPGTRGHLALGGGHVEHEERPPGTRARLELTGPSVAYLGQLGAKGEGLDGHEALPRELAGGGSEPGPRTRRAIHDQLCGWRCLQARGGSRCMPRRFAFMAAIRRPRRLSTTRDQPHDEAPREDPAPEGAPWACPPLSHARSVYASRRDPHLFALARLGVGRIDRHGLPDLCAFVVLALNLSLGDLVDLRNTTRQLLGGQGAERQLEALHLVVEDLIRHGEPRRELAKRDHAARNVARRRLAQAISPAFAAVLGRTEHGCPIHAVEH